MIKLALLLFAVVVFVLLAADWAIDQDQFRWAAAAAAAFVAAHVPFADVAVPSRRRAE